MGKPVRQIPYTNIAKSADSAKTAGSVLINGQPVCTRTSNFATSTGDEPGNRLGVKSGTTKGKAEFITASPNVLFEGVPAVRQGDLMVSNNRNTPPAPLMQAGAGTPPKLDVTGAQEVGESALPDTVEWEVAGDGLHFLKGMLAGKVPGGEDQA